MVEPLKWYEYDQGVSRVDPLGWITALIECGFCGFRLNATWPSAMPLPLHCPRCHYHAAMPIPFMQAGP